MIVKSLNEKTNLITNSDTTQCACDNNNQNRVSTVQKVTVVAFERAFGFRNYYTIIFTIP